MSVRGIHYQHVDAGSDQEFDSLVIVGADADSGTDQ